MVQAIPIGTRLPEAFWRFAHLRMERFWEKYSPINATVMDDDILDKVSFTNCYRVLDRTTQYLMQQVQTKGPQTPQDIFYRTILFKIFNLPETWEYLADRDLPLDSEMFSAKHTAEVLMNKTGPVFSSAYLMFRGYPPEGYQHWPTSKGSKAAHYLYTLEKMLTDNYPEKLADPQPSSAAKWEGAMKLLRNTLNIGPFLSYQFLTDLSYTEHFDFEENHFTIAGPQAKEGIFQTFGTKEFEQQIWWCYLHQDEEFLAHHIPFMGIPGRELQLIDIQNLFCEFTKYAKLTGLMTRNYLYGSGRKGDREIKKRFRYYKPHDGKPRIVLPDKWVSAVMP